MTPPMELYCTKHPTSTTQNTQYSPPNTNPKSTVDWVGGPFIYIIHDQYIDNTWKHQTVMQLFGHKSCSCTVMQILAT